MQGDVLTVVANLAAILTAIVATIAYGKFLLAQRRRRRALEDYLREDKCMGDLQRHTVMHLMAHLSMTEAEVLQAGFQSTKVRAVPGTDDQGRADRIYFEYCGADLAAPTKF